MTGTDQLTDLLRTAAHAGEGTPHVDASLLIARARRTRRRQRTIGLCAVVAVALLGAGALPALLDGGDSGVQVATGGLDSPPEPVWTDPPAPGWTRLPDPPLSPRTEASVVSTGDEVVVLGGSSLLCEEPGGCTLGHDPWLADGAAFDLRTRTWRPIATAPATFPHRRAIAVDGDIYLLDSCRGSQRCPEPGSALFRYRPGDDTWDVLPGTPGGGLNFLLVPFGDGLVAYGTEDMGRPVDWRFDIGSGTWTKLPADPLPPLFARKMMASGDDLLLFGTAMEGSTQSRMVVARLDVATGKWRELPAAPGTGFEESVLDGVAIPGSSRLPLGSDFPVPDGGIFDPASDAWRALPSEGWRPSPAMNGATAWRSGVVGVLRKTTATFDYAGGALLDVQAQKWIDLPPVDDRNTTSVAAVGRRLFQFGGARPGQLLNDAWVWTPPAGNGQTAPTAPPPPPASEPSTPSVPAPAQPPPPAAPGAPQFVSATGDAAAGRVTVKFDRPVVAGEADNGPGNVAHLPPGYLSAMSLIVFGGDSRCSSPQGNAHEYLSGMGTDTITTDATSLVPGTTYIGVGAGFVKSAADGTPNASVVTKDSPTAAFGGMSCIPIKVTGTVPTTQPYADPVGAPELVSATGDAKAGRVTLKFSRPVVPGEGSGFMEAGPSTSSPADSSMNAMQLVVHMTDSTCSNPNGNAQNYVAGMGTDTMTVDATSLVAGTTYISITPGFAKAADDGKAMRWVRCYALSVTG